MSGNDHNGTRAELAALRELVRTQPTSSRYLDLARALVAVDRRAEAERVLSAGIERRVSVEQGRRLLKWIRSPDGSALGGRPTIDEVPRMGPDPEDGPKTIADSYPENRPDVEAVDLLRHTAKHRMDGAEFEDGRASRTAPMRQPKTVDRSEDDTTSSFRSVGEHTQVEKIGRVVEPSVIVDDELTVTQPKHGAELGEDALEEGDGETREGPMPLTLLNSMNPRIPGTIPGKTTQGVSLEDLEALEANAPVDADFDGEETLRKRISSAVSEGAGRPLLQDSRQSHDLNTSPAEAIDGEATLHGAQQIDPKSAPQTQPNRVFNRDTAYERRVDSTGEVGDPPTQRLEQVELADLAPFAVRSDEPFLPTEMRDIAAKSSERDDSTEHVNAGVPDGSGVVDPVVRTIRRKRQIEQPQRVPYGGADAVQEGTPPSVNELNEDSSIRTDEVAMLGVSGKRPPPAGSPPPEYDPDSDTDVFDKRAYARGPSGRRAEPPLLPSPESATTRSDGARKAPDSQTPSPKRSGERRTPSAPPLREREQTNLPDDRSLIRPPDAPGRDPAATAVLMGGEEASPADLRGVAPATEAGTSPVTPVPRWVMVIGLSLVSLLCILVLVTAARYRSAVSSMADALNEQQVAVLDGNYASRVAVVEALTSEETSQDVWVSLARSTLSLVTTPRMTQIERARTAFLIRQLYELVTIFGDVDRLNAARTAMRNAQSRVTTGYDDYKVAATLDALHESETDAALKFAEIISTFGLADAHWLRALVSLKRRDHRAALKHAKLSVKTDENHPHAYPLYVYLKGELEEPVDGLEAYRRLVEQARPQHLSSQIGFERLRIRTRKRAVEAAQNLTRLIQTSADKLGPRQRASIYEGVGRHHLAAGRSDAAKSAFVAATDAVPGDPEFVEPLALLHMREFRLNSADSLIERLSEEARTQLVSLRARISLMKGDAQGAIRLLDKERSPSGRTFFLHGMSRLRLTEQPGMDVGERTRLLREARTYLRKARSSDEAWGEAEALYRLTQVLLGQEIGRSLSTLKGLRKKTTSRDALRVDRTLVFRAYARALAARKKYSAATTEFGVALKLDPDDYLASWGLCRTYSRRLKTAKAIDACRTALKNKAYTPARRQLAVLAESYGDHGTVIDALELSYGQKEIDTAGVRRLIRARLAMSQTESVKAIIKVGRGLESAADMAYAKGRLALAEEQVGQAQTELEAAANNLTGDQMVQREYAESLIRGDRSADAVKVLRKAMTIGRSAAVALTLAEAHLNIGEWTEARNAAQQALKRARRTHSHPRVRAEALAVEAQARILSGKRTHRRLADRAIRQALSIEPGLAAGLLAKGLLLETGRRPLKAVPVYTRLTQVAPRSAQGFFRLGRLLNRRGGTRRKGRTALRRAVQLDPEGIWGTRAARLLRR